MPRLKYPQLAPEGYASLSAFGHYVNTGTTLPPVLLGLVYLRASVLNNCKFCIQLHQTELRRHHEPESRITGVAEAPDSGLFTPREQAALRWTAAVTQLTGAAISDEEYDRVELFFQGKDLVDLTFAIANINAWNRLGLAFQPHWRPPTDRSEQKEAEGLNRVSSPAPAKSGAVGPAAADGPQDEEVPEPAEDDDGGKVATD